MSDQTLEVSKHDGKNEEPDFMKNLPRHYDEFSGY